MGWTLVAFEIFQQFPEHIAKAGNRADWQAIGGAGQWRKGVIGAEDVGAGINQVEMTVRIDRALGIGSSFIERGVLAASRYRG